MAAVKVVRPEVRDGLSFDTHLFDPGISFVGDPGFTKQSFKEECDINNIMRRYEATQVLDHVSGQMPEFGDYIGVLSYQESLNAVLYAQEQFAQLSAEVRDRFGNDPAKMLAFLEDEANRDEAVKLGLVAPPPPGPSQEELDIAAAAAAARAERNASPPQPPTETAGGRSTSKAAS